MKKIFIFLIIVISLFLSGCVQQNYLTIKKEAPQIYYEQYDFNAEDYKLQPYDYLYINIRTTNEEVNKLYQSISSQYNTINTNESNFYLTGFMISDSGYVYIPYVGLIKAGGKTLDEVRDMINDSISRYLNDAVINVRLANFNVYIVGEVSKQGKIRFYKEKVTILEAMAEAQGILPSGNKKKVMVIRRQDTVFQIYTLDLTKRKIIENKEFFVQPNDLIYVPQRLSYKFKIFVSDYMSFLTFLSSTATTVFLIINLTNGK